MGRFLDQIDRKILHHLQTQGRLSNVALSRLVNLSPTPCLERVRRLEREGYIAGYAAQLDRHRLGAGLLVFVEISLDRTNPDVFEDFRKAVSSLPQVLECHMLAGGFDYLMKVAVRDMEAYRRFLGGPLAALPGIRGTQSYVVMEEVKASNAIPVLQENSDPE